MKSYNKHIFSFLLVILFTSCTKNSEEHAPDDNGLVNFTCLDEFGQEDIHLSLLTVSDFIFTSDSVLHQVNTNIRGERIRSRKMDLPDGEWIIVSYGNLGNNSLLSPYVIGKTQLKELRLSITSTPYGNTHTNEKIGNSGNLYFSSMKIRIKNGRPEHKTIGYYTPIYAQFTVFVYWADNIVKPEDIAHLNVTLENVPVSYSAISSLKMDKLYNIPYPLPDPLPESKIQCVPLYPSDTYYRFDSNSLRFETGKAPTLKLMEGENPLTKGLDLNILFRKNNIDLSNVRIQNYKLSIRIEKNKIITSFMNASGWDVEYI